MFRAVHSIKGGAGAFKLDRLVRFAHTFETSLDLIRSDQLATSPTVMRTMLRSADLLADLVKASRSDHPVDEARVEAQIAELKALSENVKEAPTAASAGGGEADGLDFQPLLLEIDDLGAPEPQAARYAIKLIPAPDLYRKGNETVRLLRELSRMGEFRVECDTRHVPTLDALDPEGAYLAWRVELTTAEDEAAIQELFEFVVDDCELEIVVDRAGAAAAPEASAPAGAAPSAPSVAASAFASPIVSAPAEPIEPVAAGDRRRA